MFYNKYKVIAIQTQLLYLQKHGVLLHNSVESDITNTTTNMCMHFLDLRDSICSEFQSVEYQNRSYKSMKMWHVRKAYNGIGWLD